MEIPQKGFPMGKRIQDIAKEAGVSTATASRVFNRHPAVSWEARRKVLAAAGRYGYRPRLSSRGKNALVITPARRSSPLFIYSELMLGPLSSALHEAGYRVEIIPGDFLDSVERIQFKAAVSLAYASGLERGWNERHDAPLININSLPCKEPNVHVVGSDEAQGMRLALGRLAEAGHRRVGVVLQGMGEPGSRNALRAEAIAKARRLLKLDDDAGLTLFVGRGSYMELVGRLLRNEVSAFFCEGEGSGNVAAYALGLFGRRIPRDISLLAFERTTVTEYCVPPLTCIRQDFEGLAAKTVELIGLRLEGLPAPAETLLPYKLVERDSVGRPKRA